MGFGLFHSPGAQRRPALIASPRSKGGVRSAAAPPARGVGRLLSSQKQRKKYGGMKPPSNAATSPRTATVFSVAWYVQRSRDVNDGGACSGRKKSHPARKHRGTRAQQPRVLHLLPRDRDRRHAWLLYTWQPTWRWRPQLARASRPRAEGGTSLVGAAPFYGA